MTFLFRSLIPSPESVVVTGNALAKTNFMYKFALPCLLRKQVTTMLLILLIGSGCDNATSRAVQPIKFDASRWNIKNDGQYTYRKQMIQDLLHRSNFIGMKRESVIQMLGHPDLVQDDEIGYHY